MRTLVDQRWRITYYRGVPWGEFYDLENDPLEMDNLWDDPAAASAKRELTERLLHKMMELAERTPLRPDGVDRCRERRSVSRSLRTSDPETARSTSS